MSLDSFIDRALSDDDSVLELTHYKGGDRHIRSRQPERKMFQFYNSI